MRKLAVILDVLATLALLVLTIALFALTIPLVFLLALTSIPANYLKRRNYGW